MIVSPDSFFKFNLSASVSGLRPLEPCLVVSSLENVLERTAAVRTGARLRERRHL